MFQNSFEPIRFLHYFYPLTSSSKWLSTARYQLQNGWLTLPASPIIARQYNPFKNWHKKYVTIWEQIRRQDHGVILKILLETFFNHPITKCINPRKLNTMLFYIFLELLLHTKKLDFTMTARIPRPPVKAIKVPHQETAWFNPNKYPPLFVSTCPITSAITWKQWLSQIDWQIDRQIDGNIVSLVRG